MAKEFQLLYLAYSSVFNIFTVYSQQHSWSNSNQYGDQDNYQQSNTQNSMQIYNQGGSNVANNYRNSQTGLSQNGINNDDFSQNTGSIGVGGVMTSTREKYGPYCNGGQEYVDCATPECSHPTCLFRVAQNCEPSQIFNCQPGCRCPMDRPFWVQQFARCVTQDWCDDNGPPPRAVYGGKNIAKLKAAYNSKTAELMSRSISQGKPIDFNDFMINENGELIPTTTVVAPLTTTVKLEKADIICTNGQVKHACTCGRPDIYEKTCSSRKRPKCPEYRCRWGCKCPKELRIWDDKVQACIKAKSCTYYDEEEQKCADFYNENPAEMKRWISEKKVHPWHCLSYHFCRFGRLIVEKCPCGHYFDQGKQVCKIGGSGNCAVEQCSNESE